MLQILDPILQLFNSLVSPLRDLFVTYIPADWMGSLPAITLVVFALIAIVVGLRWNPLPISFVGIILATLEMFILPATDSFGTLFIRNAFTDFFIYIILFVALMVFLSAKSYGGSKGIYNALFLISFAGAMWVVMANDLVALFMAWEVMSTPTYVLVALGPYRGSVDGAVKYFVIGMLSSMLLAFGIALVYGTIGTTSIPAIATAVTQVWGYGPQNPATYPLVFSLVLFVIAFGFKVGIFPGWQWVPDAYCNADGNVAAYLAGATKKTGISALMRILLVGFLIARLQWGLLIVVISVATMIIGNLLALDPKISIMKMLAFSSIAQMGYLFIGIASVTLTNSFGASAALFYAFAHAIAKAGAFILIWVLSLALTKEITYADISGLSKRSPLAAGMLALFMLSLAGIPLTVGMWAKWYIFQSAVEVGYWWLALIGLINSVFSLGYYLRVMRVTYFVEPSDSTPIKLPRAATLAVAICAVLTLILFVNPAIIMSMAIQGANLLVP